MFMASKYILRKISYISENGSLRATKNQFQGMHA